MAKGSRASALRMGGGRGAPAWPGRPPRRACGAPLPPPAQPPARANRGGVRGGCGWGGRASAGGGWAGGRPAGQLGARLARSSGRQWQWAMQRRHMRLHGAPSPPPFPPLHMRARASAWGALPPSLPSPAHARARACMGRPERRPWMRRWMSMAWERWASASEASLCGGVRGGRAASARGNVCERRRSGGVWGQAGRQAVVCMHACVRACLPRPAAP